MIDFTKRTSNGTEAPWQQLRGASIPTADIYGSSVLTMLNSFDKTLKALFINIISIIC
ncbi:MAG: hypothetical protein ACYTXL_05680 [Nostoc sp.]